MTDDLADLLDRAEDGDDLVRHHATGELRERTDLESLDGPTSLRVARLLATSPSPSDLSLAATVARRAHAMGIDGAGPIYASCADRVALLDGRPQPYGTVVVEHHGELVLPMVDPAVDDVERQAMGVARLAELRAEVRSAARELARQRAATPGVLPPGQRFCRVWTDPDPDEIRARLAGEQTGAWADGDIVTFATTGGPATVTPVFPLVTWEVDGDLQALMVRVERLDEAVVTYTFTPVGGAPSMGFGRGSHDGRFRGPDAPPEAPSNDPLVGLSVDESVESDTLGEGRRVTVYRPPGHEAGDETPVVYATDGNMFAPYARRLDAAIVAGRCPPVVVVAAHAAPADMIRGNQRALEYLPGFDDRRFDAHQRFFVDELPRWAVDTLGVPDDRPRKAVFGCSDGAGHALATAQLHPDRFGHAFAFSTGTPPELSWPWSASHPTAHLCAGTLEPGFFEATEAWAGFLHHVGAPYHFTERVAGHDLIQWCEELPVALARAWGS